MKQINLDFSKVFRFIPEKRIFDQHQTITAEKANRDLEQKTGDGNDYLGWINLPSSTTETLLDEIQESATVLREKCEVVVVIGIGGSYLGAKAVIDAISGSFDNFNSNKKPLIVYAGHHLGEEYLYELLEFLKGKSFGIVVISKSGKTTEPAISFRLLKNQLEESVDKEEVKKRIIAVTDPQEGALLELAKKEEYKIFYIPSDVGGRYSIFTPAGLLPVALAGIDIKRLISGAKEMEERTKKEVPFEKNPAAVYAVVRNELYKEGKKIEILANFNPKLHFVGEWWKQLYGESEGKENKGIFPATVDFTTDLHSMGQWIQEGERSIFETVISVENSRYSVLVPEVEVDLDKLNYLKGRSIGDINEKAEQGTQQAHVDGGVPNIKIVIPELSEFFIGQLLYFFERACGISGYLLGVNPFDQPGVEAYKRNMFALLKCDM